MILYFVWPVLQSIIFAIGGVVMKSGYFGTFIFGLTERALIPFGLHHIFYIPFWQTGMGGTAVVDGVEVMGAQNIFFAELASKSVTHFSVEATRFLTGKYPFMMFGLPGAAFAMYRQARPENRKQAGSLLLSVALTSFLTGITEPIEFTFLFLAPALFVIHVLLAGSAFVVCHALSICVGTTFSDGLIDFILFGVLPGQEKSNWMMMIPVGIVYFIIYYVIFYYFIGKWDLKTPGREDMGGEMKLYSKADYKAKTSAKAGSIAAGFPERSVRILLGVGGAANVDVVDCCATRLRLTLQDGGLVQDDVLKTTGARGVIHKGKAIQVIYGPEVTVIKSEFEELMDYLREHPQEEAKLVAAAQGIPAAGEQTAEGGALAQRKTSGSLASCADGQVLPMSQAKDETFASCMLGDGVVIVPGNGRVTAPADGTVTLVMEDTNHAVGLTTKDGIQLLLHIGIDTVTLKGEGFSGKVKTGQTVKQGDLLVEFDKALVESKGLCTDIMMIVMEGSQPAGIHYLTGGDAKAGETRVAEW